MKRMIRICSLALCVLLALPLPLTASANSAAVYWEGTSATGAIVTGDSCPIVVEQETLTFDIQEFPESWYEYDEDFLAYSASVTAQYSFYNPTDQTVTATLLFPFGNQPWYDTRYSQQEAWDLDTAKYGVSVNGGPVETALRHTLSFQYEDFVLEEALDKLRDGYGEDPFYSPELPVTQYHYVVSGVDHEAYESAYAAAELSTDGTKTKVLCLDFNGFHTEGSQVQVGIFVDDPDSNVDGFTVYILGEPLAEPLEWTVYENGACETEIPGTVELDSQQAMTFRELAMSEYPADSNVLESDWYNAIVDYLAWAEWGSGCIGPEMRFDVSGDLMRWYEYEITLGPGERLTNTVTAPIYPSIHAGWEPSIYTYRYLLSPAQSWADFGTLDIVINTPYSMTANCVEGFEETENGYAVHLDGLPLGELEFTLCTVDNPLKPGSGVLALLAVPAVAAGITVAVGLAVAAIVVALCKKKRGKA